MINKKAQIKYLGSIVLVVATVIVVLLYITPKIAEAGQKIGKTYDDDDCDGDNVANIIDRCPCITTAGLEHLTLRGCPISASETEANRDKQTCGWFMTNEKSCSGFEVNCFEKDNIAFVSSCGKKNEQKCVEKEEGRYKMRCDLVMETAIQVSPEQQEGLPGKWDLTLKNVKLFEENEEKTTAEVGDDYGETIFNLESTKTSQKVKLKFDVHNVGEQNIPKSFVVSVQVCNENRKEDSCTEKVSRSLDPLASKRHRAVEVSFTVGSDGDHCDGEGDTQCTIRVYADSKNALQELDEFNNDAWIFVTLKNKKGEQIDWQTSSSIEIFADDDEDPDTFAGQVRQLCPGFVGEKGCETEDDDCDDDGEHRESLLPAGCLVHASEDDDTDENDCGWAGVKAGSIIPYLGGSEKLDQILATGISGPNKEDVEPLFKYKWQCTLGGSILCGADKSWYLCDKAREGKVLPVGGKRFRCKDFAWEEIQ